MVECKNRRISNRFLYRNGQIGPIELSLSPPCQDSLLLYLLLVAGSGPPKMRASWHRGIVAFLQVWCSSGVHYTGGGGGAGLRWFVGSMDTTA